MRLQVVLDGKVLFEDEVDYPGIPQSMIAELERTWRIAELQEKGFDAAVAVVLQSKMNFSGFRLFDAETFQ